MSHFHRPFVAVRLLGWTAAGMSIVAAVAAQEAHLHPAETVDPMQQAAPERSTDPGELRTISPSNLTADVATGFYRRPGAAVCPSPNDSAGGRCLPCGPPRPCGIGPADCCVRLPYTGFLFYGTDPRGDDPVNRTWTTCVGDQGNHGARKTVRHIRRWGY